MAFNLPPILARILGDDSQFVRTAKNSQSVAQSTSKQIEKYFSNAARQLVAAFSIGATVAFVKAQAQAADQMAKTADRLGVTTERLQALRFAARSAGAGVDVLDLALNEAQKRLSLAATTGSGEAANWIKRLNLDINELRRLAPDQLFQRYAKEIANLKNNGDRFNATQALMGESATKLINLFSAGDSAFQRAAEDIKALGIELTRVDAAQIEQANIAVDRLRVVSEGVAQQIAVVLSPYIQEFANNLLDASKNADTLRSKLETAARVILYVFSIGANAVRAFDAAVSVAIYALSALATGAAQTARSILEYFRSAESGPRQLANSVLDSVRSMFELTARIDRAVGLDSLANRFSGIAKEIDGLKASLNAFNTSAIDKPLGVITEVESFGQAMADQALERVQGALAGIKSFEQIGLEADRIVADARARAEAEAAKRKVQGNEGGIPGEKGRTDLDRSTGILADQLKFAEELAKEREKLIGDYIERELDTYAYAAERRMEIERQAEEAIRAQKLATADYAIGLFQALGQKNKAFALVALAIEKVTTIQRILMANAVAAELAFASQLIPGDPTSLARAAAAKAAVIAQGRVQAALVAATGVIQAANILSPGGNAPGSVTNPIYTNGTAESGGEAPYDPQRATTVIINGGIFTNDVVDYMMEQFDDRFRRGTVIIRQNTNQAAAIRGYS